MTGTEEEGRPRSVLCQQQGSQEGQESSHWEASQKLWHWSHFPAAPSSLQRDWLSGGNVQPNKDMTRYVKWPKYVRLQRQKKILKERLKVPPALAHFANTLDKNNATQLFKLLNKYRPETSQEKKARLVKEAETIVKDGKKDGKVGDKPYFVKKGLNHCVALIENKKAQLVVIAHDVDPIELVVYIPHLCQKRGIPYCIVKGTVFLLSFTFFPFPLDLCANLVRQGTTGDCCASKDGCYSHFHRGSTRG
jgi:ribosomal protein L7Ae-like RNA K-turn-binding protein